MPGLERAEGSSWGQHAPPVIELRRQVGLPAPSALVPWSETSCQRAWQLQTCPLSTQQAGGFPSKPPWAPERWTALAPGRSLEAWCFRCLGGWEALRSPPTAQLPALAASRIPTWPTNGFYPITSAPVGTANTDTPQPCYPHPPGTGRQSQVEGVTAEPAQSGPVSDKTATFQRQHPKLKPCGEARAGARRPLLTPKPQDWAGLGLGHTAPSGAKRLLSGGPVLKPLTLRSKVLP